MKVELKAQHLDRLMGTESLTGEIAWERELATALRGLFSEKDAGLGDRERASVDKLAYLAYTGKIENFLRDELAYRLNQQLVGRAEVGREVDRVDLVATGNGEQLPLALQVKAIYFGDFLPRGNWRLEPHGLLNELADDLHRKCDAALQHRIGLLPVTHVVQGGALNHALLAYPDIVRRPIRMMANASVWPEFQARLSTYLQGTGSKFGSPAPLSLYGIHDQWSGSAFGARVEVHWFLVKP